MLRADRTCQTSNGYKIVHLASSLYNLFKQAHEINDYSANDFLKSAINNDFDFITYNKNRSSENPEDVYLIAFKKFENLIIWSIQFTKYIIFILWKWLIYFIIFEIYCLLQIHILIDILKQFSLKLQLLNKMQKDKAYFQ